MNIQLINIDKHPTLDNLTDEQNHIFAGHIAEVLGVNYDDPDKTPKKDKLYFRTKEGAISAFNDGKLKTIWINHVADNNKEFSVKISGSNNLGRFIDKYGEFLGRGNYFLVCDDIKHIYKSSTGTEKMFYAIDSQEQLDNDFNLWPGDPQ